MTEMTREMKKLEDLLVLHNYKVRKIDGLILAKQHPKGNYRAACAKDVEDMLKTGVAAGDVFVRHHTWGKWHPVKP